jgi:hypothetical protein
MDASFTRPGPRGAVTRQIASTALALGLLTGGLTSSAQASSHARHDRHHHWAYLSGPVAISHRTLVIAGSPGDDKIALRLRARDPGRLQVDFGDDGSADFTVRRRRFDRIVVNAGGGND